jgi:PAS domain S-box-containing protein
VIEMIDASERSGLNAVVVGGATIVLFGLVVVRMIGLARAQEATAQRESVLRETALQTRSGGRLSALVQHPSDVILVLAPDTTVEYASPSVRQILGYKVAEFVGRPLMDHVPAGDRPLVEPALGGREHPSEPSVAFELRIRHRDGRLLHTECLFTDLVDHAAVSGIVVNVRDITERKRFEEQLAYQAFHDSVTDLANRALFHDRVEHALSRRGQDGRSLAVLFLDLDDFKIINDTFGHATGDRLLLTISGRLRSALRVGDTVARLGGRRVRRSARGHEPGNGGVGHRLPTAREHQRASLVGRPRGLRSLQHRGRRRWLGEPDRTRHHRRRDAAQRDVGMYQAKAAGGDIYRHFKPEMHETMVKQLELRTELKAAIAADELTLHYQPIFDLGTGEIAGYEARDFSSAAR